MNCGKYEDGAVCNKYGDHGSKYSALSPWNKYASNPPVIVDQDGGFYGYFTAAKYHPKRTTIEALVYFTDNFGLVVDDPVAASDAFCGRE